MSIIQGPSFKANESIPSYRVVAVNASTSADAFRMELADTSTSVPLGIIQDEVSTDGSKEVVTFGQARAQCGASVAAGVISWQTATGKVINATNNTATAIVRTIGVALQPGSTDSVIKVIVNPNYNKLG